MSVRVRFSKECLYKPQMHQGVNKLFGFSKGWNHMENSTRLGWTSDGEKIIIHSFEHVGGSFESKELYSLEVEKDHILFVSNQYPKFFGYRLYPYFGGVLPAPKDMTIYIEWLK